MGTPGGGKRPSDARRPDGPGKVWNLDQPHLSMRAGARLVISDSAVCPIVAFILAPETLLRRGDDSAAHRRGEPAVQPARRLANALAAQKAVLA